jgi:hypothetical protein
MAGPDRWEPEDERPSWLTFVCSRCGTIGQPTGDGSFPEWSAMIVRRRDGASVGVALDGPLDLSPLCLNDFSLWFSK